MWKKIGKFCFWGMLWPMWPIWKLLQASAPRRTAVQIIVIEHRS